MDIIYPHCAGLDVHKKTVVACRIFPGPDSSPVQQVRTFSTMTADLLELSDWLAEAGVTQVAMESTGEYWKPVYNLLENNFELWLIGQPPLVGPIRSSEPTGFSGEAPSA